MIEQAITDLAAAVRENTAAVNQCIAIHGGTLPAAAPLAVLPDPPPAKAPKGGKKATATPEPDHGPAGAPPPNVEPEAPEPDAPDEDDRPATADELKPIRDAYAAGSKATSDLAAFKAAFAVLRESFKIAVITDLRVSQVAGFLAGTQAL